ncbi:MAG: hydantoinase B/oxoprolinase family protein [Planctomycetota bacterium]|jgi:N-methylhydantoinase B
MNPADLAVFDALFASIAEEMGAALERAATSTNIKERRDLSCAVFDESGRLIAQAAHIPVHLGAMPLSVRAVLERRPPQLGDVVLLNDPWAGGTHLPDLTAVAASGPFLVANRAHHADVGGAAPGSLGLATDIHGEGLRIPPVRIIKQGRMDLDLLDLFCANVRAPRERREDLIAQVATLKRGIVRLEEAAERVGLTRLVEAAVALRAAAGEAARETVRSLRPGVHRFEDELDGGLNIRVALEVRDDRLVVDFDGTHGQVDLPLNANPAVTWSAVTYAFALLLPAGTPLNEGVREALDVRVPEATLLNASYPSPVAGGNVETSQRIVDVVLGALDQATGGRIPAASQGTMNNLTVGGAGFTYYETIAGGAGAGPTGPGAAAIQTHMTNTRNTPIEALENSAPMVVRRLQVARGTGGTGAHPGGDGVLKEIEFLAPGVVHLLADRRTRGPYGLEGGGAGACGKDEVVRGGAAEPIAGRTRLEMAPGDRLRIRTPGGGGYGAA